MIDWVAFIDSLDEQNFNDIVSAVQTRIADDAESEAEHIVLSFGEVEASREDKMLAIRMVHKRLGCTPLVAKHAVEQALCNAEDDAWSEAMKEDRDGTYQEDGEETVIGYEQMFVD